MFKKFFILSASAVMLGLLSVSALTGTIQTPYGAVTRIDTTNYYATNYVSGPTALRSVCSQTSNHPLNSPTVCKYRADAYTSVLAQGSSQEHIHNYWDMDPEVRR